MIPSDVPALEPAITATTPALKPKLVIGLVNNGAQVRKSKVLKWNMSGMAKLYLIMMSCCNLIQL